MMKGGQPVPAVFFNVYKQENISENGPTHTWKNFNLKEDTIILMDSDFVTLDQNTIVTELDSQGNLTYVLDEYSKLILYGINLADMSTNYLGDQTLGSQLDNDKETQETQNIQENVSTEVEANNSFSTADIISSGTTISGTLHSSSDMR